MSPGRTDLIGAPGRIRTHDPQIRSLVLYPAELPVPREGAQPMHHAAQRQAMRTRMAFRRLVHAIWPSWLPSNYLKLPRKPQALPLSRRALVDKTFYDLALPRRMRAGYSPGVNAGGGFGERQ